MKTSLRSRLLCIGLFCAVNIIHAQTITYQDAFEHKGSEDGTPVDSRNIGKSMTAWEATPNAVLAKDGGVRASDDNPFVCRLSLPTKFKEVAVEADINPVGKAWMAVAMGAGDLGNPNFGGLFLIVFPGGAFRLMFTPDADDTRSVKAVPLKSGRIKTWKAEGMNTLKLVYNRESDTVNAIANGEEKILKDVSMKEKNFVVQAEYAGVSGIFQSTEGKSLGKFLATITQ